MYTLSAELAESLFYSRVYSWLTRVWPEKINHLFSHSSVGIGVDSQAKIVYLVSHIEKFNSACLFYKQVKLWFDSLLPRHGYTNGFDYMFISTSRGHTNRCMVTVGSFKRHYMISKETKCDLWLPHHVSMQVITSTMLLQMPQRLSYSSHGIALNANLSLNNGNSWDAIFAFPWYIIKKHLAIRDSRNRWADR